MSQTNPAYVIERSLGPNKGSKVFLWDHNGNMGPGIRGVASRKYSGVRGHRVVGRRYPKRSKCRVYQTFSTHTHMHIYFPEIYIEIYISTRLTLCLQIKSAASHWYAMNLPCQYLNAEQRIHIRFLACAGERLDLICQVLSPLHCVSNTDMLHREREGLHFLSSVRKSQ